jgi:hypothetical protein
MSDIFFTVSFHADAGFVIGSDSILIWGSLWLISGGQDRKRLF